MTDVILEAAPFDAIRAHGERTYPEECCGFLLAPRQDPPDPRRVVRAIPSENRVPGMRNRRFVILPDEVAEMEREAERANQLLVGFYHSHPDHPAAPSQFDEEHAWPWYSYLVLRVENGHAEDLGAFTLDAESRRFQSVPLSLPNSSPGTGTSEPSHSAQTPSS